jgi:hypothetical protein
MMVHMGVLARLGAISRRWDTPQTPWWRRREFIFVMLGWIVAAVAGIYSLITWTLAPLPLSLIAVSGSALGSTLRHRSDVRHDAEPPLRPSTPADANSNPYDYPVG